MYFLETLPDGSQAIRGPDKGPRPEIPQFETLEALLSWLHSTQSDPPRLLWRGVSDYEHYRLHSKLQRVLTEAGIPAAEWLTTESRAVDEFQRQARAIEIDIDNSDRLAWLGIMQHYGAPTRLTEWSWDPRVALWFACVEERPGRDRALFVLDAHLCQSIYTVTPPGTLGLPLAEQAPLIRQQLNSRIGEAESLRIGWPLPLPVVCENARTIAQEAVFVCDATLASPLELLLTDEGWETAKQEAGRVNYVGWHILAISGLARACHREQVLQKIRIPAGLRDEVVRYLAAEGVNKDYLFPDAVEGQSHLDGIGASIERLVRSWGR